MYYGNEYVLYLKIIEIIYCIIYTYIVSGDGYIRYFHDGFKILIIKILRLFFFNVICVLKI